MTQEASSCQLTPLAAAELAANREFLRFQAFLRINLSAFCIAGGCLRLRQTVSLSLTPFVKARGGEIKPS